MSSKTSRRELLAWLAAAGGAWSLRAQEPTFSTDVTVVNVLASVRTKNGEIVRDLSKDDFMLEEDSRPQTIRYFSQETNLPLTLGLLVDTSGSQRAVLEEERTASYRFLDEVLREDRDLAFLIHFDFEVELLQDLTSSRQQLQRSLRLLEIADMRRLRRRVGQPGGPRGGTALFDAVLLASDELMRKQTGRKALIILSDGVDNGSRVSITEAMEAAQRADTLAYSILFADDDAYNAPVFIGRRGRRGPWGIPAQSHPDGKKILQRISRETGGGFYEVGKKHTLAHIYYQIQEELRNQYNLGYSPDRADVSGGFRRIRVSTKRKDLVVQAREGYFAKRG